MKVDVGNFCEKNIFFYNSKIKLLFNLNACCNGNHRAGDSLTRFFAETGYKLTRPSGLVLLSGPEHRGQENLILLKIKKTNSRVSFCISCSTNAAQCCSCKEANRQFILTNSKKQPIRFLLSSNNIQRLGLELTRFSNTRTTNRLR